jgi:hypothetical protein
MRCGPAAVRRHLGDPIDLASMEPRDGRGETTSGGECAACGRIVPANRIRILAARDDLAFAELSCGSCGSQSLAMVVGESRVATSLRSESRLLNPIGPDDVLEMHEFLAGYGGGLRELIAKTAPLDGTSRGPGTT